MPSSSIISGSSGSEAARQLTDELWSTILGFLHPLEVLRNASLVSPQLHRIIDQPCFWSLHPLMESSSVANNNNNARLSEDLRQLWRSLRRSFNKTSWKRICLWLVHNRMPTLLFSASQLPPCLKPRSSVISPYCDKLLCELGRAVCIASSTESRDQTVANVLLSKKEKMRVVNGSVFHPPPTFSFWSSLPTFTRDTNETLLFVLKHPLTLVQRVQIKAFQDPYFSQFSTGPPPVYAWNQTIVRAYHVPPKELRPTNATGTNCSAEAAIQTPYCSVALEEQEVTVEGRNPLQGQEVIDRVLKNATLVYENCFDDDVEDDKTHTFHLNTGKDDEARIVIGNVITLELVGKRNEQHPGMGYYACVDQLECFGIPLIEK